MPWLWRLRLSRWEYRQSSRRRRSAPSWDCIGSASPACGANAGSQSQQDIDEWRSSEPGHPSRSDAIRTLLGMGLSAAYWWTIVAGGSGCRARRGAQAGSAKRRVGRPAWDRMWRGRPARNAGPGCLAAFKSLQSQFGFCVGWQTQRCASLMNLSRFNAPARVSKVPIKRGSNLGRVDGFSQI